MNIGRKIKELRVEKLMTQSELAGSEITRNMLSRIENGAALPSLGTILYLAKKLGVPAGYLLSEGDEEFLYIKTNAMKNIRRAYTDKNFELCRDICLSTFEKLDDELELILTDCCIGIAEEYIKNGMLHTACEYLDEAVIHSRKTMFDTTSQKNSISIMFCLLKDISPALDSNETDTIPSEDMLHPSIFKNILCKYITVILDINNYRLFTDDLATTTDLELNETDQLFVLHLKAREQLSKDDYHGALETLKEVVDSETVPPRLLLYLSCADIEICCKETENYKGAYEYSQNKIEILEHMLADL